MQAKYKEKMNNNVSRDKEKWSDKWGYDDNEKQEEHIENKDREGGGKTGWKKRGK